jgi:hypothetical protein
MIATHFINQPLKVQYCVTENQNAKTTTNKA